MTVLFSGPIHVHYGFLTLAAMGALPDLTATRQGQQNGLCGAATPGALSMVTGLHTGNVPVTVEWLATEPELGPDWDDVVEVPFEPFSRQLVLSAFDTAVTLELPASGPHRARYHGAALDAGSRLDTAHQEPAPDRYLLQLWPAAARPDAVIRQGSENARYWHQHAQALPPPPSAEELAAARRIRAKQARRRKTAAIVRATAIAWGGRVPSPRLAVLGGNIWAVVATDRDLLDRFEQRDETEQRALARWLARRAFERARIAEKSWVTAGLAAMDRSEPLPEPFTDFATAFDRLYADEQHQDSARAAVIVSRPVPSAPFPVPPGGRRIHRPSFAIPALFSAVQPDPLRALVDTFSHAAATFDDDRESLLVELHQRLGD